MTKTFSLVILLLLLSGLASSGVDAAEKANLMPPDSSSILLSNHHKVMVYYLYFNPRCETCLNMEAFSKEAVERGFAKELKQGTVEWHAYDMDSTAYKHFWDDFKLETKSLIMVDVRDGRQAHWKNCEKIWELAGAKPDFLTYVQEEVRAYLQNH